MKLTFKIEPYPKRTAQIVSRGRFPHAVKNEKTRVFEESIRILAKSMFKGEMFRDAISVKVTFFLSKPKSCSKRVFPNVKPDIDNFCKSFLDGCNGVIWEDDSLICELIARKEYSTYGGFIVLEIQPIESLLYPTLWAND